MQFGKLINKLYHNFGTVKGESGYGIRDNNGTIEIKDSGGEWSSAGLSGYSGFSGKDGISGYQGSDGDSGYSGFSGFSGQDGINGDSGYSGFSGIDGTNGTDGDSGFSGKDGIDGDSGFSGFSGYSGSNGVDGTDGDSGFSGFSGSNGTDGSQGDSGYSGYSGIDGSNGDSGFSGFSGASGIGSSGYSGFSGYSGAGSVLAGDIGLYGFLNVTESSISFDGTDTFTLTDNGAGWSYYRNGVKCTISGNKTKQIASPMVNGTLYYIFIDANDGTLSSATSGWTLNDTKVPVATLFWNSTLTPKYVLATERHTCKVDRAWHREHHFVEGTQYVSGGVPTGYTLNSTTETNKVFGIPAQTIADEDLFLIASALTKPDGATPTYYNVYRTSTTNWVWALADMPFKYSGTSPYNYIEYDNGSGSSTPSQNNKFVNTYIFVSNAQGNNETTPLTSTTGLRYFIVQGRGSYSTSALAYGESFAGFDLTGLPVAEGIALYQLTWDTTGIADTVKGRCKLNRVQRITSNVITTSSVATASHNTLAGLQGGAINEYFHLTDAEYTALQLTGGSGWSGYSGFSGQNGTAGDSGYSGFSGIGTSGYSGINGTNGSSGYSGYSGISVAAGYTATFTNSDLTAGILTVTHNLGIKYNIVSIYDNNDKQVLADEVTLSSTSALSVDLSSYGAITGTWRVIATNGAGTSGYSGYSGQDAMMSGYSGYSGFSGINGASGASGYSGYSGQSSSNGYTTTFTNASLSAGILTVTHNLGIQNNIVGVFDNNNKQILPDEVTNTSTTVTTIDLSSYGSITGTWSVIITNGIGTSGYSGISGASGTSGYSGISGFSGTVGVEKDGTVNPNNLLSNGDFEAWSAGTSAAPDGWTLTGTPTIAQGSTTPSPKINSYYAELVGNNETLYQDIKGTKGIAYFQGRKVTFGCWVWASEASRGRIFINDGVLETDSTAHTGNSTWQWLTVTHTVDASATKLECHCWIDTSAGDATVDYDGAICVEGSSAFAYGPKAPDEGVWADYKATSTIAGWTGTVTGFIYTKKIGKTVFVNFSLAGTSNATTITFTVPYLAASNPSYSIGMGQATDNNVTQSYPLYAVINGASTTVSVYKTLAAGAWTNSGTKVCFGNLIYEMA